MKHRLRNTLATLLGIVLIGGILYYMDVGEFLKKIKDISPLWVIISSVIVLVSYIFRALRLKVYTPLSTKILFGVVIGGYSLNALLPLKIGDIAMIAMLKKYGMELKRSINVIVHCRILDLLALALITAPLSFLYVNEELSVLPQTTGIFLVVFGFLAIVYLFKKGLFTKIIQIVEGKLQVGLFKKVIKKGVEQAEDYGKLITNGNMLALFYSIMSWVMDGLVAYTIAVGLNEEISFGLILIAVTIANISKVIPATPGGIGLYEGTMILFLGYFGVSALTAGTIAIVEHLLKNIITIAVGGSILLKRGLGKTKIGELIENEN